MLPFIAYMFRNDRPLPPLTRAEAQAAVDRAVMELDRARKALREAVQREIAALPVMAQVSDVADAHAALLGLIGEAQFRSRPAEPCRFWSWSQGGGVLRLEDGAFNAPMELWAGVPGDDRRAEQRFPFGDYGDLGNAGEFDAAVRGALTWLAERDVFLLREAP